MRLERTWQMGAKEPSSNALVKRNEDHILEHKGPKWCPQTRDNLEYDQIPKT